MSMITDTHYGRQRANVCLTCDKNSQEGSDLFTVLGALAHFKKYGEKHGGFETVELEDGIVAGHGGILETAGEAYD